MAKALPQPPEQAGRGEEEEEEEEEEKRKTFFPEPRGFSAVSFFFLSASISSLSLVLTE